MISTRLLTQFIVVADELHFGRAAIRLHMSQPPLSQAIIRLESMLKVKLLTRSKKSISLTDAGKIFLEEAKQLIAQEEQAIVRTRLAAHGFSGTLTVGFVGSVSYGLLPKILAKFQHDYPEIAFDLKELTSSEQVQELQAKRIDIGIVRLPLAKTDNLKLSVILKERMIAVLPHKHPLANRDSISLASLKNEQFMMFPVHKVFSLHAKTLMACQAAGFSPRISLESWQMPTMVSLVAAEVGVALLPSQIQSIPHPGVRYCTLKDKINHLDLEIAVAWNPDISSRLTEKFIEICYQDDEFDH